MFETFETFEKNGIESDLKRDREIELVTGAPNFDDNDSYEDEKGDKGPRNTEEEAENAEIDYDSTDNDVEAEVASSSPKSDQAPRCRGDDTVRECQHSPHIKICESQLCDGVNDCPSGEDEDQELCRRGENFRGSKKTHLKKLTFKNYGLNPISNEKFVKFD